MDTAALGHSSPTPCSWYIALLCGRSTKPLYRLPQWCRHSWRGPFLFTASAKGRDLDPSDKLDIDTSVLTIGFDSLIQMTVRMVVGPPWTAQATSPKKKDSRHQGQSETPLPRRAGDPDPHPLFKTAQSLPLMEKISLPLRMYKHPAENATISPTASSCPFTLEQATGIQYLRIPMDPNSPDSCDVMSKALTEQC